MPWEITAYLALHAFFSGVLVITRNNVDTNRHRLANVIHVCTIILVFLPGFISSANNRLIQGYTNIYDEAWLVASHVMIGLHNQFIVREQSVPAALVALGGLVIISELSGTCGDGAFHRIFMLVCLVVDQVFGWIVLGSKFPKLAENMVATLMAIQFIASIFIVIAGILSADRYLEALHLFAALMGIPFVFSTDQFIEPQPIETISLITSYERVQKQIGNTAKVMRIPLQIASPPPVLLTEPPREEEPHIDTSEVLHDMYPMEEKPESAREKRRKKKAAKQQQ